MTTQEVANRLIELCREGKYEQAVKELYSPDIVSVEPEGMPDHIVQGLDAIAKKGERFQDMLEKINSSTITDPIVAENFFSCGMYMNVVMKGMTQAIDMDEICVYTVNNGKIVKEEFFYTPDPQEVQ
ncbi:MULTISPECIES: nuclear transport factor 2 family protein [unclassified Aureispira]|uniref:nuclear transport factor 2 family protein n=1 Tax=unclassified Aureispira TaxID=2649989 RepID=UPI000696F733|nr:MULTISPECIES: nuclear transport factor 2 family protein [unclassified Aureispira]WMX13721.1 nuclear transport factor 2 family protein [Aureispira sp. CCB-E]